MHIHASVSIDIDGRKAVQEFNDWDMTPESLRRHLRDGQEEMVLLIDKAKVLFPTAQIISLMEGWRESRCESQSFLPATSSAATLKEKR